MFLSRAKSQIEEHNKVIKVELKFTSWWEDDRSDPCVRRGNNKSSRQWFYKIQTLFKISFSIHLYAAGTVDNETQINLCFAGWE